MRGRSDGETDKLVAELIESGSEFAGAAASEALGLIGGPPPGALAVRLVGWLSRARWEQSDSGSVRCVDRLGRSVKALGVRRFVYMSRQLPPKLGRDLSSQLLQRGN